jgi:hypothetical protein
MVEFTKAEHKINIYQFDSFTIPVYSSLITINLVLSNPIPSRRIGPLERRGPNIASGLIWSFLLLLLLLLLLLFLLQLSEERKGARSSASWVIRGWL